MTKLFEVEIELKCMIPALDIDKAELLAIATDYYTFSVGEEINTADAGAFFLEGYEYAKRLLTNNKIGKQ